MPETLLLGGVEYEMYELWVEDPGGSDFNFKHTILTGFSGSTAFHATVECRQSRVSKIVKAEMVQEIPPTEIYPEAENSILRFDGPVPLPENHRYFVKRPKIHGYGHGDYKTRDFLQELKVCTKLATQPHKNLPVFHGAVEVSGRFVCIVLDRYQDILCDKIEQGMEFEERWKCFNHVQAAVRFLHTQFQMAHNDVCERNIMRNKQGDWILIDFSSALPIGETLVEVGTDGWNEGFKSVSDQENDEVGLRMLKRYLELE